MTLVCVPIMVGEVDAALRDALEAKGRGADLVELRLDEAYSGEDGELDVLAGLVEECPLPCIVTCRPVWEGGHYDGDEMHRAALFERLCVGTASPPRYIDVELAAYGRSANFRQKIDLCIAHPEQARDVGTGLILSMHDFEGRPSDLSRRLGDARGFARPAVLKVAYRARSVRDNLELFEILRERDRPTIALGMGEAGLMSRVLAPKFGGFLTFASLREEAVTAPGQPTIEELVGRYRVRSIGRGTKVYGVVGWPVGHSRGPLVHNAGFEAAGFDGAYVPLPVADSDEALKATVLSLLHDEALDLGGLSVTLPHKRRLVGLGVSEGWEVSAQARVAGAANTVVVSREGGEVRVSVVDTDAEAVCGLVEARVGELAGMEVAVVGAGGVARSIAAGVCGRGGRVGVFNRSRENAEELVGALQSAGCEGVEYGGGLDEVAGCGCPVIVHATSVGMAGGGAEGETAFDVDGVKEGTLIVETVYSPRETALVRAARGRGLDVVDGVEMFVRQAQGQFALWTGQEPAKGLFERLMDDDGGENCADS